MVNVTKPKAWQGIVRLFTAVAFVAVLAVPRASAASAPETANDDGDFVVVLHGLGRSKAAMRPLARRLRAAGYQAELVGYRSMRHTPNEMLRDIARQISHCCSDGSRKVHFVGHSLGGVMVRAYLARHRVANLGRVVLLGTPNGGSQIIERFKDRPWFSLLGPAARELGTGADSLPRSIGPPYYPLGIIAGKVQFIPNQHLLPGDDDGLVTVEATKIDRMDDFVIVETRHAGLRHSREAARQVVRFLDIASFDHTPRVRKAVIRISR